MKEEYDFSQGKQVAIDPNPSGKTRITTMLDDGILEWLHGQVQAAGGSNYQTLINNALHEHIQRRKEMSEAEEKTHKELYELYEVFELLEKIAPKAARNAKRLSLRDSEIKAPRRKWEKVAFIGVGASTFAFILAAVLLSHLKTIQLAFFTLGCAFFITFFLILFLGVTITKDLKNFKDLSRKRSKYSGHHTEYEQKIVNELSKKASQQTLKVAKIDFEFSLKKIQTRNQTASSFLPILGAFIAVAIIFVYGNPVQFLGNNSLSSIYDVLRVISGLVAPLLPIANFFDKLATETIINEYNSCLFLLEKAQVVVNNVEANKNSSQFEQLRKKQSLMSKLKNIKIDGPEDFAENIDLYLSGEKRIEPDIR